MLFAVAIAALVWVGLLLAAPILPASAAAGIYGLGSIVCHQISERSFHLAGFQLPVCARCFGLYLGGAVGAAAYLPAASLRHWSLAVFTRARTARPVLAMAFAPTLVTVVLEAVGLWGPSNMTRAIAALPAGAAVALVVMNALGYTTFNARGRG